eukprot:4519351-Karenia_brevis.AAC.1
MVVTAGAFQPPMSWLKASAHRSILGMSVLANVSRLHMFLLKAEAPKNNTCVVATTGVFQLPMSWLKAEAL